MRRWMVVATMAAVATASADTLHVPADFPTIQAAIDAAFDGDTVQVQSGFYNGQVDFLGKAVAVIGAGAASTTLDGTGLAGSVVHFISGEGPDSVLQGFRIGHGTGEIVTDPVFGDVSCGGGIIVRYSSPTIRLCWVQSNACWGGAGMCNVGSSPDVIGCTFSNNTSDGHGGGMYNLEGSEPHIEGCLFQSNSSSWGGGMTNTVGSHAKLINCTFSGNQVTNVGGGIYNRSYSSPTIIGCEFLGNVQSGNPVGSGGGMCTYGSGNGGGPCYPIVMDCLFEGNVAAGDGGGMVNAYDSHPTVTNCTFRNNYGGRDGGGMACVGAHEPDVPSNALVDGCLFEDNEAAARGGGFFSRASEPTLLDCVIRINTAPTGGGAAFFESEDTFVSGTLFCANNDEAVWGAFIDGGDNVYEDECAGDCPADVDGDGTVGVDDVLLVLSGWGGSGTGDIDGDGLVNVDDLLLVIAAWGPC